MRATGDRPRRRPARKASTPVPAAVMIPMPVIQTRRRAVVIAGSAGGRLGRGRGGRGSATRRRRHGLGDRLERRERPSGDRPREPAVDDAREPGEPRGEVVLDPDVAAGRRRLDVPGHVHAAGRPGHVDEPEPPDRGLRPRPRAPRDRQADAEERDERPAGDEVHDQRAVAPPLAGRRARVVGQEVRPALDVAGEAEHQVGRRGDVDGDRGVHRSSDHGARSAAR